MQKEEKEVNPLSSNSEKQQFSPNDIHTLVIVKKTSPKNLSVDCRSTVGRLSLSYIVVTICLLID